MAINVASEGFAHFVEGRRLAAPKFQSPGALVKQHAQPVGGEAAVGLGRGQERRLGGLIYHVVNILRLFERELLLVNRQRVARLEPKGSGIEEKVDEFFRVADLDVNGGIT